MKNVKTRVEALRNEIAILKEAINEIPLESPPKQNHKVNANKTTQTTQTSYKDSTSEKGHDFIDNNNITFGHLKRGGLHVNQNG